MMLIPIQADKIPSRSVIYLVLCVVILSIFSVAILYPYYRSLHLIDAQMVQIRTLLKKQKTLLPLYEEMVKGGTETIPDDLPIPDIQALSREEAGAVPSLFKDIADKNGMQVVSIRSDVLTLTEASDDMVVTITLGGRFSDFRKFLLGVGRVPSLKWVEEMEIRQEGGHKHFSLTVRLALG